MLDVNDKTPLHYLINKVPRDYTSINFMLEYILDYMEHKAESRNSGYEIEKIHASLGSIFTTLIKKVNSRTLDRYLKSCYLSSFSLRSLPEFGQSQENYTFSKRPVVDLEVESKIHRKGQERVNFNSIMVPFNYNILSRDMIELMKTLAKTRNEQIFKAKVIEKILDYVWVQSKSARLMSFLFFSLLMTVFSIYIGFEKRILPLEVAIVCLATINLWIQIKFHSWKVYALSVYNVADLVSSLLIVSLISARMADINTDLVEMWLTSLTTLIGYLRWVSYLRYFKSTSKLYYSFKNIDSHRKSYRDYRFNPPRYVELYCHHILHFLWIYSDIFKV